MYRRITRNRPAAQEEERLCQRWGLAVNACRSSPLKGHLPSFEEPGHDPRNRRSERCAILHAPLHGNPLAFSHKNIIYLKASLEARKNAVPS